MTHWITATLGTSPFHGGNHPPDVVLVDVRFLVDRAGNTATLVAGVVEQGVQALDAGKRVLICCDHGISRSNAIAAGVLSRSAGIPLSAAVEQVLSATGGAEIRVDVLDSVRLALGEPATRKAAGTWLLLGGHGALGTLLVNTCPAGVELVRPARSQLDLQRGAATLDLLVRERGVCGVIHLAAPRIGNTNTALGQGLVMLRNVLDVCASNNLRVLVPSRWEVFGGHRGQELHATEDTPLRPAGVLGDTKALCEFLVQQYVSRRAVPAALVRSGLVVGGGAAPHFLKSFVERARAGQEISTHLMADGEPRLDLVAASDWTAAVWAIVAGELSGVFHCGGGRLTSTREVAQVVIASLNSRSGLNVVKLDGQTSNVLLESGKLASLTGWTPRLTPDAAIRAYAAQPRPTPTAGDSNGNKIV